MVPFCVKINSAHSSPPHIVHSTHTVSFHARLSTRWVAVPLLALSLSLSLVLVLVCAFCNCSCYTHTSVYFSTWILLGLQVRAYKWSTSHRCSDRELHGVKFPYSQAYQNQLRHQRYHHYTRTYFGWRFTLFLLFIIEWMNWTSFSSSHVPTWYDACVCSVHAFVSLAFAENSEENTLCVCRAL